MTIDSAWNRVAHAVAVNEHRAGFPVHSIFTQAPNSSDSSRLERGFLGAHSDIGGGYAEGDLSDVALMWIVGEAQKTGIELTIPDEFKAVTNPTVHDSLGVYPLSVYNPSREFLWAGQSTTGSTQFESKEHLVFNWENSIEFENEEYEGVNSKFKSLYELSEEYKRQLKADCSPRFGSCIRGGRFPNEVLKDIKALKSEGVDEDLTILYDGKDDNQKININKYIDWLNGNRYDVAIN